MIAGVRTASGEVLHFSEDPTIKLFVPHVPATAQQREPYVWAVDSILAPAYWFPRDCPRAMAWVTAEATTEDRDRIVGPGGGTRVHAIEYPWVRRMMEVRLFAYRLPADAFLPFGYPVPHAFVATQPVESLGPPEAVGDLLDLHHRDGIQLRVLPSIKAFWNSVTHSTLGYSGIRLLNSAAEEG
jgi:hypothetical protein